MVRGIEGVAWWRPDKAEDWLLITLGQFTLASTTEVKGRLAESLNDGPLSRPVNGVSMMIN
jgi:hypothetical protein